MAAQYTPSMEQVGELVRLVAKLGKAEIARVATEISGLEAPILHPQALLDFVASVLDRDDAEPLVRHLLALHGLARQTGRTIDEVLASLRSSIERHNRTNAGALDTWTAVDQAFSELLHTKSVRLAAAAVDLAYDYTNLLRRTRILTDVRPIFDWDGEVIEGAVVSFTLRIRYDNAQGEHEISIAMDALDVDALWDQCRRARKKALAARQLITETCNRPATVFGEAFNGTGTS